MEHSESYKIFRALADASRLKILNALLQKPHYVEELAERLNLSVSTVSFHIKKLDEAGLIYKAKEQYYTILQLNKEILGNSLMELISFNNRQSTDQDERFQNYSTKVINTFFSKGRLIKLPSQYKKRIIILEAMLTQFEKEKVYTENEIDEIINKIFDDHCTIRRYFIDENMMFRKRGKYTLNEKYKCETIAAAGFPYFNSSVEENHAEHKKNSEMKNRNEIKKQYKQTLRPMGVYLLKDIINNKIYLGSSKNLDGIFNRHRFELTNRMHQIPEIQGVWDKSGEKGISLEVIDKLEPKEDPAYDYTGELKVLENLWYEKLRSEDLTVFPLNGTRIRKATA